MSFLFSRFSKEEIKQILKDLVEQKLNETLIDNQRKSIELSKDLSQMIKNRLKLFNSNQYKYVIQVCLCQYEYENVLMTFRSIWNIQTDFNISFMCTNLNSNIFCAISIFALFHC